MKKKKITLFPYLLPLYGVKLFAFQQHSKRKNGKRDVDESWYVHTLEAFI